MVIAVDASTGLSQTFQFNAPLHVLRYWRLKNRSRCESHRSLPTATAKVRTLGNGGLRFEPE
jgi:hypothetical protein